MKVEGRPDGHGKVSRSTRVDAGCVVLVRCEAGSFPARITNLSSTGFRMSSARALEPGWEISVEVPKRPPVKCVIRWADGKECGGAFLEAVSL